MYFNRLSTMKHQRISNIKDRHADGYRLVIHPSFDNTIAEMKRKKISLPDEALPVDLEFAGFESLQGNKVLEIIGELGRTKLDARAGEACANEVLIFCI
jgi:hypothetical protein